MGRHPGAEQPASALVGRTFYVTIVWAIGYTIAYPAWPLLHSATKGVLGYSSRNEVKNELTAAEFAKGKYVAAVESKSVSEIAADDGLREFAVAAGGAAFKVNCVQCHGSGAQGSKGFPNLNDDDWLWGGDIETIHQGTIAHGVRFTGDEDTRLSEMPAFGEMLEFRADQGGCGLRGIALGNTLRPGPCRNWWPHVCRELRGLPR